MNKKKATKNDKVYIFEVKLGTESPYYQIRGLKSKPSRTIAILGSQSLHDFAEAIVDSFNFSFDHCFGFYDNLKIKGDSTRKYELFTDIGDEPTQGAMSVKKTMISQVFNQLGEKMLFFYDYGDCWQFIVTLKGTEMPEHRRSYPILLEKHGRAPAQYTYG